MPANGVVLAFTGPVADFAAPVEANRPFQRVVCVAFIEPGLGAAPKVRVKDPVDHYVEYGRQEKKRPL
jgi:hypothetical protein